MRVAPLLLALTACAPTPTEPVVFAPDRATFNQAAAELGIPVFQKADGSFVHHRAALGWTGSLADARAAVSAHVQGGAAADLPEAERRRRALVQAELRSGRVTLIETDLSAASAEDKAMVGHLLDAAAQIEALYARQRGGHALMAAIPADDGASRTLFWRNAGPWCEAGPAADDPECRAVPEPAPRRAGVYPAEVQADGFCDAIAAAHPDVMQPFMAAIASEDGDGLVAVPYPERWPEEHAAIAASLRAAADAAPADEVALVAYLRAAADAFGTNDWFAADAAWAAMNQRNSRWYLRVGPDETYWDPCNVHAGYHMVLARVNPAGLAMQDRLEPHKQQMEQALAELAGPPYQAREVGFDLPEFIEIALNAGDSRDPIGATIGQSLPNWGPVAEAGGRTVAMTNMGTDPDSVASTERALSALFCEDALALWPREPEPLLFSTVLHEAAHNLGPAHEYAVDGKTDVQAFGGPMAQILEELKSQTAALWLVDWLLAQGVGTEAEAERAHVADIAWAFGHISRGLVDGSGNPKTYSQLAAVQVGYFADRGALTWRADATAANGTDAGCWSVDRAALSPAIDALAREVFRIKATGDRAAAEALIGPYVDPAGPWAAHWATADDRWSREPRSTYVYRVALE